VQTERKTKGKFIFLCFSLVQPARLCRFVPLGQRTFDRQVKGSANRAKCKINLIYFHFLGAAYLRPKVKGSANRADYPRFNTFSLNRKKLIVGLSI